MFLHAEIDLAGRETESQRQRAAKSFAVRVLAALDKDATERIVLALMYHNALEIIRHLTGGGDLSNLIFLSGLLTTANVRLQTTVNL